MTNFVRGGTFIRRVALRDNGGRPVDLTGVSVTMDNGAGGAVLAGLACQIDPNAPASGVTYVSAESTATAAWALGASAYRLRLTFPDGIVVVSPIFAIGVTA